MTDIYTVEIDGTQYDIEGDRPPSEAEARQAIGAYTPAPHAYSGHSAPAGPTPAELAASTPHTQQGSAVGRFVKPAWDAIKSVGSLPGAAAGFLDAADAASRGDAAPMAAIGEGVVQPHVDQARRAQEAIGSGHVVEGLGHAAAAAIPVFGPAAADIGEAAGSGNFAGAIGQAAVMAAPFVKAESLPAGVARVLKKRAAAREFDLMKPTLKRVGTAEEIAGQVAGGTAGRETAGGIGIGDRATLAARAKARSVAAGKEIEALQKMDTPVDIAPVVQRIRDRAAKLETVPPDRIVTAEQPSGILDASGQMVMNEVDQTIKGVASSEHPALVSALRTQAKRLEDLATQYEGGQVPAGELFKQRGALGRRVGKTYDRLPGDEHAAAMEAGKIARTELTGTLHERIPASKVLDNEYRVFRNAYVNFERARRAQLTATGVQRLKNLLAGRAAGAVAGGLTGGTLGGLPGGVVGALGGVVLGESAFWGSLRADTYSRLAKLLNTGDSAAAADILSRAASTYAMDKGVKDRERNLKAHRALQNQAEGVVAP